MLNAMMRDFAVLTQPEHCARVRMLCEGNSWKRAQSQQHDQVAGDVMNTDDVHYRM